jgi:hypothetical protein
VVSIADASIGVVSIWVDEDVTPNARLLDMLYLDPNDLGSAGGGRAPHDIWIAASTVALAAPANLPQVTR